MLAITNGVKIAEEVKEGTNAREGSKYPEADEITDVAVMVGLYATLVVLELVFSGSTTSDLQNLDSGLCARDFEKV